MSSLHLREDKIQNEITPYESVAQQYTDAMHQSTYHNKIVVPNFLHLVGESDNVKNKQVCFIYLFLFLFFFLFFFFFILFYFFSLNLLSYYRFLI